MDYIDKYLLIVSCSQRKRSELELLPAIDRYDGPVFQVVRRFLRSRSSPVPLDIYILSAEFGLIASDRPIPNYDRRITKKRSSELRPSVIEKLIEILKVDRYQEIFICAGKDYLRSLEGYEKLVQSETIIKIAPGGIGTKSSKLKDWLYNRLPQESPSLSTAISPNNENMEQNQINCDSQQSASNISEESVARELQNQPHVILKLQENALTIAENLRDNYFKNTAKFIYLLRRAMIEASQGKRDNILKVETVKDADWSKFKGEVVTFIDGGLGQVKMSNQVPILLRVGSYRVKAGEHNLEEREQFGYYPVIFGDIEGGSKERKDFPDIVRITAELLGGLSALERTKDLRVLMFHGPLMYLMSAYAGHTPFTEKDIDLFLKQYGGGFKSVKKLKDDFFQEAELDIYPQMSQRSDNWIEKRLFEPLAWIAFLYRKLIREAKKRNPRPIIVGVVERSYLKEFSQTILLERIFRGLRKNKKQNYFNELYDGRKDLNNPKAFLDGLGYTDTLLLSMLLESGRFSESWIINKCGNLDKGQMSLPGESFSGEVNWGVLKSNNNIGFPKIRGFYLKVSETTEPLRIEVFEELYAGQIEEVVKRVYLYAKLLPGYGFPIGLDIVDKYAHIPNWLTNAYEKLIKYHLSISLQTGDITDEQMRRIIVQSIYMTKRDWLFRPKS